MPSEPIVVATDLTARSDRAIDRAFLTGREQSRSVLVVHALDEKGLTESELARRQALVRSVLPDHATDAAITLPVGSPPETIARTATERNAVLLVAGVARYNELRDRILGTAVDYIVRHSTVPVLVVSKRPHRPYRNLLAATDYSEPSKQAILVAARLFPEASIEVVHAYKVPFESWLNNDEIRAEFEQTRQAEMDSFLADPDFSAIAGSRLSGRIEYGGLQAAVDRTIEAIGADLLVLGTHGESGFRHATIGSNANALLANASIDCLMVPPSG